jgi:hypothetical protein
MTAEQRERMTETFAAVRDALLRSVVPTVAVDLKKIPDYGRPWYLPPIAPPSKAAGRAQMLRLASLVPNSVKGYDN